MSTKNKTNLSHHNESVKTLENTLEKVMLGGGEAKLKKEAEKGKLSARERIAYLLDKSPQIEIGALTALDMYSEHGGCPSAGVVVIMGYIGGTLSMMIAYIFFMLRDIKGQKAKNILLGVGSIMAIADAVIIASNLSAYEKFPTEPMIATPQPAVALWIILTAYTLYVAVTTKK